MQVLSRLQTFKIPRWWIHGLVLAALVALPAAARQASDSWHQLVVSKHQWSESQVQADKLAHLRIEMAEFERYQGQLDALMQRARASALAPLDWEERSVDVRRRELTRREAAGFLSGAGRGQGYFFIPERFDLRTVQTGNDIFHYRKGDIDRLRMTLKGVYLARGKK